MSLREGSILDNLATVRRMASAGGGQEAERGNREEPGLQRHRLLPDSAARSAGSDPAPLCPGHSRPAARSYNLVPQVAERPDQALCWGVTLLRSPRLRNCDNLEFPEPERVKA